MISGKLKFNMVIISFEFFAFSIKKHVIVLTNSFQKKSQKTPKSDITLAEKRKGDWLRRNK